MAWARLHRHLQHWDQMPTSTSPAFGSATQLGQAQLALNPYQILFPGVFILYKNFKFSQIGETA